MSTIIEIIAKNPPSILLTFGSIGLLGGMSGAGTLLFLGFVLQVLWTFGRYFI